MGLAMCDYDYSYITTVKGPVQSDSLGFCHSHEHLFLKRGRSAEINPDLVMDDFDKTVKELSLFKRAGGKCIVDAQPVGCGRMEENLVRASELTGLNIIASTGFHKLVFYPAGHWIHELSEHELARLFRDEIKYGMLIGNGCMQLDKRIEARAGVIKVAADENGISGEYCRLFSAAAQISAETGAPILCHTEMGKHASEIVQYLTDFGVPPCSIILCHLDRVIDNMGYYLDIAEKGVFMEFDTIGRFKYHSDEEEARLITFLVEQGCEDNILLGLDTTRSRMKSYGGQIGLDYIQTIFLPLLKSYGLRDETIYKFMVKNPSKAFSSITSKGV